MKQLARLLPVSLILALALAATTPQAAAAQGSYSCPTTSGNSYSSGGAYQHDLDNPVRPAWNHLAVKPTPS